MAASGLEFLETGYSGGLDRTVFGSIHNWSQSDNVALDANTCAISGSSCTEGRVLRALPATSTWVTNLVADHFPRVHDRFGIKEVLNRTHEVAFVFRDKIQTDLFEWFVISFDKKASTPVSRQRQGTEEVSSGLSSIKVPGTDEVVKVEKRRKAAPILSTPAVRLGADKRPKGADMEKAPDPRRILYRPWLFHGTPLWRKFETR